jgi:DNA-binding beta-propeller fold protein YncE
VTVTLANPLTIPGGNGSGVVTISGVTDASFDGTFVVTAGSGTTTLMWAQAGANSSSSGGSAATGSVLGTVPVSNGTKPQIAVIPQIGWAIVTPGGAGTLSVVDLTRQTLVFSASITATTLGVAVNTETKNVMLADPSSPSGFLFSLLDESITSLPLTLGNVAAAANPFTNVGLLLNPGSHLAYLLDLNIPREITTIALGTDPIGVALDPATNMALVVDDVDATVSVVNLGDTRSLHGEPQIFQMTPTFSLTSSSAVPMLITGAGFTAASQIRLNETAIPTTFVSSRVLTANIPPAFLTSPYAPVRIVVDVQNSPTLFSNVVNLLVALPVPVGNSPQGVAIDQDMDRALVANSGDGTVSVINISPTSPTFGMVTSTLTVGSTPLAVGVVSRNGMAVATNSGSSTASIIDLNTNPYTVPATVSLGSDPTGIGISESLGAAIVTNTDSNSVSQFTLTDTTTTVPSSLGVDTGPVGAGVAPDLNYAVTAESTANDATILNISSGTPSVLNHVNNLSAASGVEYDPVNQVFLIQTSGANTIVAVNPTTLLQTSIRTGVNPTSLAYNFQDGALLTLNSGSSTFSVIDLPALQVRDVMPFAGGTVYAMAIHRRLEFVLISDPANNRVLLLPLPR